MTNCYACRVAPFGYLRIIACLTAPHSFSQLTTPFIAPPRLGIHHTPFVACPSSLFHVELPRAYTRFLYFTYLLSKSCFSRFHSPFRGVECLKKRKMSYFLYCKSLSELGGREGRGSKCVLRKEVIQPQVPLRLPCYDFTPVTSRTLGSCVRCRFARSLPVQPTPMV